MTRATRSSTTHEKEKAVETPPAPRRAAAKKRKRTSTADTSEQPVNKHARTQDGIKVEGSQDAEEQPVEAVSKPELPSSGDVPIRSEDAEQILEVLEMVDTQGLLDRIFPLATEHTSDSGSSAGPSTGTQSYSFRALLKSPSPYPLRVLRCAVQHLFPISSHPRSRPSAPAAEQLKFCQLALSLLDQVSFHSAPVPLDVESLLPASHPGSTEEGDASRAGSSSTNRALGKRKYALVQRLPTGDWWSSINSSYSSLAPEGKDLKDLPTSYAELVAVLPSASTSPPEPLTLGHYAKPKTFKSLHMPQQHVLSCGTFLNYGPYASFAPTFEQNGAQVGHTGLSEVVWFQEKDRHRRARIRAYRQHLAAKAAQAEAETGAEGEETDTEPTNVAQSEKENEKAQDNEVDSLEGLLTAEQIANVKSAAGSLELEDAVSELLERNARALNHLEALQWERLLGEGSKEVVVDSEEWQTAQSILDALTLLASLRPRSSSDDELAPLIPPASVLHKLHRTLPVGSMQGWYGTLPDTRAAACRDDTTIKVRAGAPVTNPVPAPAPAPAPVPTPAAPAAPSTPAPTKPAAPPQGHYQYSYTTPYRGTYNTYAPQPTSNYYPNYQTPIASTQTPPGSHYPNHQYNSSNQQPYSAYSSWYNYQPPANAASTSAKPANYGAYYNGTQQPQPQRAVANTVLTGSAAAKTYPAGTWANGSGYVAPTLPPHMRGAVPTGPSTPGTPQPVGTAQATGTYAYYSGYQPPPTPAR